VSDADRDEHRREVAARGLTPLAVTYLVREALGRIELDALAPVKGLLKQFFSEAPWTRDDDDRLAELVGPGEGWWEHELEGGFTFAFGWRGGPFRLELARTNGAVPRPDRPESREARPILEETFEGAVVPEATPNPRTIRFMTSDLHAGPSRWYESATQVDDRRVARLFEDFDDVANVLVGPNFVAVGIRQPDRWEQLLAPVLRVVSEEFAGESAERRDANRPDDGVGPLSVDVRGTVASADGRALPRAWRDLRALDPDARPDLERLLEAASSEEVATRQVAARILVDAEPDTAARAWAELLGDSSRTVRRATVDAMVDADRPTLRPLLERALGDTDAWTRWKALRGVVGLGVEPSRDVVAPLATDPDFRVRLEAAAALRGRDEY
jgi:hypothetical protein